jgi:predicted nucleic acid-binding protein
MRLLVDTNVILDVWLGRKPFLASSALVLEAVFTGRATGLFCSSSVTDLHYICRKELGESAVRKRLTVLIDQFELTPVLGGQVRKAIRSSVSDFEDAVLDESAFESNADFIVTRNSADFARGRVPAITPEDALRLV